jgi:hypothetical protein
MAPIQLTLNLPAPQSEMASRDLAPASGIAWGVGVGALVWAVLLYLLLAI